MHELHFEQNSSKEEKYISLLPQLKALVAGEPDLIANLANVAAVLKESFSWWWVGFYLVKNNELVLGPFQGPLACTLIGLGKGVCGSSWQKRESIVVDDVEKFPGHIACSSASRSEIVIPIIQNEKVVAVLDADSEHPAHYDATDKKYLEELCNELNSLF